MTFTYNLTGGFTDLTRVRFDLGDTDSSAPKFQDEEINAVITEQNNVWQRAVIALIGNLMSRLNIPDFKADWLQVDASSAREGYRQMRDLLLAQYGLGGITAEAVYTYRADSLATDAPVYPVIPYDPNRDF